jgi:hypothetical protein
MPQSLWSIIAGLLMATPNMVPALAEGLSQFATEIRAKKSCPTDNVVWLNTDTGTYHLKGMRWYGNTANGAFICQFEAIHAGYRSSVFCRYCSGH